MSRRHDALTILTRRTLVLGLTGTLVLFGCRGAGKSQRWSLRRPVPPVRQVIAPQPERPRYYVPPQPTPAASVAEPDLEPTPVQSEDVPTEEPIKPTEPPAVVEPTPDTMPDEKAVPSPSDAPQLPAPPAPDFESPDEEATDPFGGMKKTPRKGPNATAAKARPISESPTARSGPAAPVTSPAPSKPSGDAGTPPPAPPAPLGDVDSTFYRPLRPAPSSVTQRQGELTRIQLQSFDDGTLKPRDAIDATAPPRMASGVVRRLDSDS